MRLLQIVETGIPRRDFLKKTAAVAASGKGLLKMLLDLGVGEATAASIVSAPRLVLRGVCHLNPYSETADEDFKNFREELIRIQRIAGTKSLQIACGDDSEYLDIYSEVDQNRVAKLLQAAERDGFVEEQRDGVLYFELANGDGFSISNSLETFEENLTSQILPITNPVKQYWDMAGSWHPVPFSSQFDKLLRQHGVDPTDREDWIWETLAERQASGDWEPGWGGPERYGISQKRMEAAVRQHEDDLAKAAEHRRLYAHEEPESLNPRPDDEYWGHSMHQPMESRHKLCSILGHLVEEFGPQDQPNPRPRNIQQHNPAPGEHYSVEELQHTGDQAIYRIIGNAQGKRINGHLTLTYFDGEVDGWDWTGSDLSEDEAQTILDLFAE